MTLEETGNKITQERSYTLTMTSLPIKMHKFKKNI